jgi:hypothetical protein
MKRLCEVNEPGRVHLDAPLLVATYGSMNCLFIVSCMFQGICVRGACYVRDEEEVHKL